MNRINIINSHIIPNQNIEQLNTELINEHIKGSGVLWNRGKNGIKKAIELYLEYGITSFPLVDIQKETKLAIQNLINDLTECEKLYVDNELPKWNTTNIFFTGGTGFIGIHLLANMLNTIPNCYISCLIRGKNELHCKERLCNIAKSYNLKIIINRINQIKCIPGDITKSKLGMTSDEYENCLNQIDTVIHLAAKDNYFLPFQVLRKNHINGFLNIIKFCASKKIKPLMYYSSSLIRLVELYLHSENNIIPNNGLYNGYAQTKFVAHMMAEKVHELKGKFKCVPPICLINLGYVYPGYSYDTYDIHNSNISNIPSMIIPNITDSMEVVLKVCLTLDIVPDINFPMDYAPIEYVTNCITEILHDYKQNGIKYNFLKPKWYYIYNPHPLYFKDAIAAMQQIRKKPLQFVSMKEFSNKWQETLSIYNNNSCKYLKTLISDKFDDQLTKTLDMSNDLYISKKYQIKPIENLYLVKLVDIIDKYMNISN